jgi:hypothetical protein
MNAEQLVGNETFPDFLPVLDPLITEAELLLRKINKTPQIVERFVAISHALLSEGKPVSGEMVFQRLKEEGVRLCHDGRTLLIRIASHRSPQLRRAFELRDSKYDNLTPDFFSGL